MLKIIGIVGVIAASTLLGFFFATKLKTRQTRLSKLCGFIEEIEMRITSGAELKKIIETSGENVGIYSDGYKVKISPEGLDKKDISILEEFFSFLGLGDTPSQIKRCKVYLSLLKKQEEAAAELVNTKSSLYSKLGFFAGLFISVMLI